MAAKSTSKQDKAEESAKKLYVLPAPAPQEASKSWVVFDDADLSDIQFSTDATNGIRSSNGRILVNPNAILVASEIQPRDN